MNPPTSPARRITGVVSIAGFIVVAWLVYLFVAALLATRSRGLLEVTTPDNKTVISLSRNNSRAVILGTGSSQSWLEPGRYELVAASAGKQATYFVTITTRHTTKQSVQFNQPPAIPSVDSITFTGFDTLITNGLTTTQVINLKNLFFSYKETTRTVTVNTGSVRPGPHDPNGSDPTFTMTFSGTIDSTAYAATISYTDLTNVQLTLVNPDTNTQLYTGSSVQSAPDD